jgi:hypothetical protein
MGYPGVGGKLIHDKTRSKKSRDTVPLKVVFVWFEKNIFELFLATVPKIFKHCWRRQ